MRAFPVCEWSGLPQGLNLDHDLSPRNRVAILFSLLVPRSPRILPANRLDTLSRD